MAASRAAARLGQTEPDDGVAARYPRQPFPCDDGRGVLGDHAAHQRSQQLNVARIEIAIGDLLDDDAGGCAALAEAAIFFRQIDADQAEAAHFLQHLAVDAILPGSLLIVGSQFLFRESLGNLPKRLLLLAERVVHGNPPADILRSRVLEVAQTRLRSRNYEQAPTSFSRRRAHV